MAYWLCVTSEDNWRVVRENNVWGVADRFKGAIQRVKPGDKLVFYVMQTKKDKEIIPSRIVGIFEAVSEPYRDSTKIFKAYGTESTFPHRVELKPIKIFDRPLFFKELVPKLSFIKNKQRWSGSLRRAMVEIPEKDYKLITEFGGV
ncbi:MAG: EVE domain-containing protein [Candidatus Baldrarchaeia archaeon]